MAGLGGGKRASWSMGKRKTAGDFTRFLRALERTGNARAAARMAGMDVGTAYDRRYKDEAFAARWVIAAAKGEAKAAAGRKPRPGRGPELVLRTGKNGSQLVRAAPERWSAEIEAAFRATLRRTGCVSAAADACGLSTNALYYRRDKYPVFAADWAADLAHARATIPALLAAAAIAVLDPEIAGALPPVNVDQAIKIAQMKSGGGEARRARQSLAGPRAGHRAGAGQHPAQARFGRGAREEEGRRRFPAAARGGSRRTAMGDAKEVIRRLLAAPPALRARLLAELAESELRAFDFDWPAWMHQGQEPPEATTGRSG